VSQGPAGRFVPATVYGRTLQGLSVNLVVPDVLRSAAFLEGALSLRVLFADTGFAAITGAGARIMLHADSAYQRMPALHRLTPDAPRGSGVEIRLLGIDPDLAAERAPAFGGAVLLAPRAFPHGWREAHLADPDGYLYAVGLPVGEPTAPPSGVRLRPLRSEDGGPVLAVIDDWWGRPIRSRLPHLFFEYFATTSFAAEDEETGELLGFLCGFGSPSQPQESYVHFVGVAPKARRRGVARALYAAFFDAVRALGCTAVTCITAPVNRESIAFHERLGFALVEGNAVEQGIPVHRDREGPGTAHVVMRRELWT
jgi:GNAT superfamily N-acetyltransferase